MSDYIVVTSDRQHIIDTDYWQTEQAAAGLIYCSVNAGAFRLLVPRAAAAGLELAGEYVIVSSGLYNDGRAGVELLWEDGSDTPFSIHIDAQMMDRRIPIEDDARIDLRCIVYVERGSGQDMVGEWPARYRIVDHLPYLKPWGK